MLRKVRPPAINNLLPEFVVYTRMPQRVMAVPGCTCFSVTPLSLIINQPDKSSATVV